MIMDPNNCLSCGEPEVNQITYDFIPRLENMSNANGRVETGWHYKDAYQ